MNQILYYEKQKKGSQLEISTTIKIFTIILIVLGIVFIAKGSYGIYKEKVANENHEPAVTTKEENGKLQISINHNKAIDKIIYSWNFGDETTLQGKGQTNITENIELPIGNNTLTLKIIDSSKKETTYQKVYFKEEEDTTKPEIEFEVEGSKIKIVAKDETELSYIMYHWNDEEDTIVEVQNDAKKLIEERITILKGENTLVVVAVDAAGNEEHKEQIFKGAKKPKIEAVQEGDKLRIKISDEENIKKIEINQNGTILSTDAENKDTSLNVKEVELTRDLVAGNNTITITVYSVNGLSEQITKEITI